MNPSYDWLALMFKVLIHVILTLQLNETVAMVAYIIMVTAISTCIVFRLKLSKISSVQSSYQL